MKCRGRAPWHRNLMANWNFDRLQHRQVGRLARVSLKESAQQPNCKKTCNRILHLGTIVQSGFLAFNSTANVFDPPNASRSHERTAPVIPQAGAVTCAGAACGKKTRGQHEGTISA